MTVFCQTFSMSRLSETLSSRVILTPHCIPYVGLLRLSIFDAVEKSVKYSIRAKKFATIVIKHLVAKLL